ncbi:MAG: alanine racemase, partial [Clostridia bacterium]|nr:alanine racemase [Clostridia bacterium]
DHEVTRKIQMIFQDPMASLNERAKVDYIVSEGIYKTEKDAKKRKSLVDQALLDVGLLPEFSSRFPHEFSGGQRQRIGIARALIMQPEFIIADEPISALDVSIRAQVLNLLSDLQRKRNLTYLFISHDLSVMRFICDRIAVIHKGKIVELADTEELFKNPLHPYTRALLSAIPMPDPVSEKNKTLIVYDPSVHDYSVEQPEWVEIRPGHFIWANKPEIREYNRILRINNKDEYTSRCWAEINMGALIANYHKACSFMENEKSLLIPVLKANAYGCGAKFVANALYKEGARMFAVASYEEAVEIKNLLPDANVLVMGMIARPLLPLAIKKGIIITAFSEKNALEISEAASLLKQEARVHFKMDTGLHRLGFGENDIPSLVKCASLPFLRVEGLYTHLALRNKEEDDNQFRILSRGHDAFKQAGISVPMLHACDSIGMVRYPERHMDACRVGAWLYGVCPNRYQNPDQCREVVVFKTRIAQIHNVEKGQCVGYDEDHPLLRKSRVATLSCGYVDGFPRFNNEGYVLIEGKKAPVLGLVCMDQMMVDVTDIPEAAEGGEVTLLGGGIYVNEYASMAHFNRNECLCRLGRRVPKVYHNDGEVIDILTDIENPEI